MRCGRTLGVTSAPTDQHLEVVVDARALFFAPRDECLTIYADDTRMLRSTSRVIPDLNVATAFHRSSEQCSCPVTRPVMRILCVGVGYKIDPACLTLTALLGFDTGVVDCVQ
jgi:hypothetical protein